MVGIVFGALILVGGAWWAWNFKKRRHAAAEAQLPNIDSSQPIFDGEQKPSESEQHQNYELREPAKSPMAGLHESGGRPIHEMHNSVGQPGK